MMESDRAEGHAASARSRRHGRLAQVPVRRHPERPGARQRPRDGLAGGGRGRRADVPASLRRRDPEPHGPDRADRGGGAAVRAARQSRPEQPGDRGVLVRGRGVARALLRRRRRPSGWSRRSRRRARTQDTIGGIFEVVAYNVPIGLGSHTQWDEKIDGRLAGALMSMPSIKAVEIGEGVAQTARRGSTVHDVHRRSTSRTAGATRATTPAGSRAA